MAPCPFCEGEPRLLPQPDGWKSIDCIECGAMVKEHTEFDAQIIKKWNRRINKELDAAYQTLTKLGDPGNYGCGCNEGGSVVDYIFERHPDLGGK
jgi:hypothetical protein